LYGIITSIREEGSFMGYNPGGGGSSSIASSTDVLLNNPASDQALTYDDSVSKWRNVAAPGSVASVNSYTGVVTLTKSDLALGSVDNTSDSNKPISALTQAALDDKADASVVADLALDISDLQTNKADISYRYWNGTGGVGSWEPRPSVPVGRHVDAYSTQDELAPPPPSAVAGDLWFRHPEAT
jgi:hypothetical protein